MAKYIDKDALVAWAKKTYLYENASMIRKVCYKQLMEHLDTSEVKEVDLEEEIERIRKAHFINDDFEKATLEGRQITNIAKHFFKLGMRVNNPITAADRGTAEEIIINLKRVENDYRIDLTKEIMWVRNKVQK